MIFEVTGNKKEYLPLLLLADEQEDMIDRYLEKGAMYVLEDGGIKDSITDPSLDKPYPPTARRIPKWDGHSCR